MQPGKNPVNPVNPVQKAADRLLPTCPHLLELNSPEYRPIIGKEKIRFLHLFRCPTPEPGTALVLFRAGQPLRTLWPANCPPLLKGLWGNYKLIYKVDVTEHGFGFDCDLPSQGDGFYFRAEVRAFYCVDDPAVIVERNVTDAYQVLRPLIVRTLRRVSREHDVKEIDVVEKIMTRAVKNQVCDTGFRIKRCVVNLSLEGDARAYIRKLRQIERDEELKKRASALQRQQDELEIERLKIKMSFYGPLVRQGHWQLLALQLAQRPQDVATVVRTLGRCRQTEMAHQLKVLKILSDAGALDKTIPLLQRLPVSAAGLITTDMVEARIPVKQARLFGVDFALRVQNDDLCQIGIVAGDVVLVHCQDEVENGSVAVVIPAQQRAQTQYILRRIFCDQYRFRLVAECPGSPCVTLAKEAAAKRIRVIGRVVGVKKRYPRQQDRLDV